MKTVNLAMALGLLSTSLSLAQQGTSRTVMRDAATHDQLALTLRKAQTEDPMRGLQAAQGKDPSKENQPESLLSRSEILCFNGLATLVPKGSILVLPPALSQRLGMKDGAKIVTWPDFYAANRGWVVTQEISLVQAEGREPLAEAVTEKLKKSSNLVVATLRGGPISKLAPKVVESPAKEAP